VLLVPSLSAQSSCPWEFVTRAAEIGSNLPPNAQSEELVCEHKKSGRAHCYGGLCSECYDVFVNISEGGSIIEQPAFQNAKRQKIKHKQESGMSERSLSDINVYINTERDKQYKTLICELIHKEYLEEC